jgi:hypothetical protein
MILRFRQLLRCPLTFAVSSLCGETFFVSGWRAAPAKEIGREENPPGSILPRSRLDVRDTQASLFAA